jgi:hypothetical protein
MSGSGKEISRIGDPSGNLENRVLANQSPKCINSAAPDVNIEKG